MSETELSVICKNCGSEVSPYVTECPYCGARLRKRAPKLERRGDGLEAQQPRRRRAAAIPPPARRRAALAAERPYATLAVILGSAVLLLVQKATGDALGTFGGLDRPARGRVVALPHRALRLRRRRLPLRRRGRPGDLRRPASSGGSAARRRRCCCSPAARSGCWPRAAIANAQGDVDVIAGGNGMALGAVAAWFAIRRAEAHGAIDEEYDVIGVAVAAVGPARPADLRVRPPTSSPAWSAAPSAASPGCSPRALRSD